MVRHRGSALFIVMIFLSVCTTLSVTMWRYYGALAQRWRYRIVQEQRVLLAEGLARAGCAWVRCKNHDGLCDSLIFRTWPPGSTEYSGSVNFEYKEDNVVVRAQLLKDVSFCYGIVCTLVNGDHGWKITEWRRGV